MAPAAIGIAAIVASVASAAAGVYASVSAGQQQKKAQQYNAAVYEQQARIAEEAAASEEADRRRRARHLLGTQLAATGAGGLQLEGSPLLAMVESGVQEDLEARRIRYRGYLQAVGYGSQAAVSRYEGSQAAYAGYIGAGQSLLRGASNTTALYKQYYG